jgi:serine beta-lactamase-like protein LACTB, mitochondrial
MFRSVMLIALTLTPSVVLAAADSGSPSCRQDAGDRIEHLAASKQIPGIAAAVGVGDQVVWSFGFGLANVEQGEPVAPERSRFRIGSTSKALTAFALMRLVDAGKVDLDAPVEKYVAAFPEGRKDVTLRRLGGHLAGVRHYNSRSELASEIRYLTVTDSLKIYIDDPLIAEPGEAFVYSTYGYTLISAAIESATEEDFLGLMSHSVFEPIGMTHTVPDEPREVIPNRTGFYYVDGSGLHNGPEINSSYKWAGGGFLSSAVDLARFGLAHFDTALLSEPSRRTLWTSQQDGSGADTGYGIGWFIGDQWVQHPGGSLGGSALLRIYPEDQVVVVLLANLSLLEDHRFDDLPDKLHACFSR